MKKLLVLPVLLLLLPQAASAKPAAGHLDPSFGQGGRVTVPVSLGFDTPAGEPTAIAKLPGGKVVALAGTTLLAFDRHGRPDRAFGGGRVEIAAPAGPSLRLADVAVDQQGRVLVAGTAVSPVAPELQWPVGWDEDAFMARFTARGEPDPGFGQGGVLRTDLGGSPLPIETGTGTVYSPPRTSFEGMAIDGAGRIVLSGLRLSEVHSCRFTPNYPYWDAFLGRLLADGSFDPSFGQGGIVPVEDSRAVEPPVLTRAGGAYLYDVVDNGCSPQPSRLSRFDVKGVPVRPPLTVDEEASPTSVAIDRSGRVLLASAENALSLGLAVASVRRFLPSGRLDPGFGGKGLVRVGARRGLDFEPSAVRAGAGGEIVLAGTARPSGATSDPRRFMVARLTGTGKLDRRFSRDGRALTRFGKGSRAVADDVTLVRGGILVSGRVSSPSLPGGEGLALARYLAR